MKLYIQTDPKWSNVSMAIEGDLLGRWGCLITSLSNIFSFALNTDKLNPKDLNDIVKQYEAYQWYVDKKLDTASNLCWERFKKIYDNSFSIQNNLSAKDMLNVKSIYYIARLSYKVIDPKSSYGYMHYVNVLDVRGDSVIIFDTYKGGVHIINVSNISWVHQIQHKE